MAEPDEGGEFTTGWRTVLACAAGACAGLTGLAFYSFGLFVKPLSQTFGWTRGQVGLGLSFITLGLLIFTPLMGALTDRFGVRRVALPSLAGAAVGYAGLSFVGSNVASFYLACFLLASLGAGTTPVTWTRAVAAHFRRQRGLALGLTMLGSAAAPLLSAAILQPVITAHGFRAGYLAVAGFSGLIALPVAAIFMASSDDAPEAPQTSPRPVIASAVQSAAFWILAAAIFVLITAQSGVTVSLVPLLTDRGVSPARAAAMAALLGVSVFGGRVAIGALLDKLHPPSVAGAALLAPLAAVLILSSGRSDEAGLMLAVILLGFGAGAEMDILSFFIARHFGIHAYGRIYGLLFVLFSLGNGLGTPLIGASFDHFKSYTPALLAAAALFALGALLFVSLGFCAVFVDEPRSDPSPATA